MLKKLIPGATGRQLVVFKSTFHHLSVDENNNAEHFVLCVLFPGDANDFTIHCMFSAIVCRSICLPVGRSAVCSIFSLLNEF